MTIPEQYLQPAQTVGIVYWGRSGTLLLHSLLDSHPDVLSCNAYFWHYSSYMDQFLSTDHGNSAEKLLDFICETYWYLFEHWPPYFPEMFRGKNRDLPFGTNRERFIEGFREYLSHFPEGTPFCSLPAGHTIHSFVLQAIHVAYAIAQGQSLESTNPTIVWQTHFWQPDYFRQRFPNLRILSAVRHPLSSYDSWQMRAFTDERVPPFWFYHCLRLRQMIEFMKVPPDLGDRCRTIRFEDIHNRTEAVMRSLAQWLNIRWDKRMLESTFDGEPYWGVKGGCVRMFKPGEVPPVEAVVTGTRQFDETKVKVKYLGAVDKLRMQVLCADAFDAWNYRTSASKPEASWLTRKCAALLLLWPSRLDRLAFREDLRLELVKRSGMSMARRAKIYVAAWTDIVRKKWRFCREMLGLKHAQRGWQPIRVIDATAATVAMDECHEAVTIRRAA